MTPPLRHHPDPKHPSNLPTWRKLLMLATMSLTAFAANEMAAAHLTVRCSAAVFTSHLTDNLLARPFLKCRRACTAASQR